MRSGVTAFSLIEFGGHEYSPGSSCSRYHGNKLEPMSANPIFRKTQGHSTGGGEVTRYIGHHGTKPVTAGILIAPVPQSWWSTGGAA